MHGFDLSGGAEVLSGGIRVYSPDQMTAIFELEAARPDILLIFINDPTAVLEQATIAAGFGIKVAIGTTGLSEADLAKLKELGVRIPILVTSNFSLGVNLLKKLVALAAAALPGFDVEIVEEHHGAKLDSPSGTASMLVKAVEQGRQVSLSQVHGRSGRASQARQPDEIGVHAVRAGKIAGNHEAVFAGQYDVLRLRHEAISPIGFAAGALVAIKWMSQLAAPGWYSMDQVLGLEE